MSANERQIGGDHYKTEYEHWDLVLATGMGYLEGCATKYVSRWRKKDGVLGLEKALHYVEKLRESGSLLISRRQHPSYARGQHPSAAMFLEVEVERFVRANDLSPTEHRIIADLVDWDDRKLMRTRGLIKRLIEQEVNPTFLFPNPKPVPLTEENHYGERASKDN